MYQHKVRLVGGPFDGHRDGGPAPEKIPPLIFWMGRCPDCGQEHLSHEWFRGAECYRREEQKPDETWIYVYTDAGLNEGSDREIKVEEPVLA